MVHAINTGAVAAILVAVITSAGRRLLLRRLQVLQVQLLTKLYFREVFRPVVHHLQRVVHRLTGFMHSGVAGVA